MVWVGYKMHLVMSSRMLFILKFKSQLVCWYVIYNLPASTPRINGLSGTHQFKWQLDQTWTRKTLLDEILKTNQSIKSEFAAVSNQPFKIEMTVA